MLAKNLEGWKKLIRLISASNNPEFFYRKPRIDIQRLQEYSGNDLIGICGHLGSFLADKITENNRLKDDWKTIGKNTIAQFKDIFGSENFFLESQLIDKENNPIQVELTDRLRDLSKITNTKIVCTPDAHYCRKEDAVDQRILLCNNLKTTFPQIQEKANAGLDIGM